MKKTLSIILAVILMFSAVSVMAFAEDATDEGLVTINFYVDAEDIGSTPFHTIKVLPGKNFTDRLVTGEEAIGDPEKAPTEEVEYIFKGWSKYNTETDSTDPTVYVAGTIPVVENADEAVICYVAVFAEQEVRENQTFWQFVASIFARINAIFEYFAKVFEGVVDF